MIEKGTTESGKILAISLVLFNLLILTAIGGLFWIVQILFTNTNQLNAIIYRIS